MKRPSDFQAFGSDFLPGLLGIEIVQVTAQRVHARLAVRRELMAPNGFLHAGTLVTLADTCAGYGCIAALPDNANGFTTIELKSNHLGTALDGHIECVSTPLHVGRTTQVWDAVVTHSESGRTLAQFRCTQLVLYPRG